MTRPPAFRVGREEAREPERPPTAVLVWHGMGQQIHFETIEIVARVLAQDEHQRTGQRPLVTPRQVDFGGTTLWRVELEITSDGRRYPVHVYEAYWAPVTQGKITLAETVKALLLAGVDGVRYGLVPPRVLPRFLFGQWIEFALSASQALIYLVLLLAVVALVVVNLAIVTTASLSLIGYFMGPEAGPGASLLHDLTIDLAALAAAFAVTGAAFGAVYLGHRARLRDAMPAARSRVAQWALWGTLGLTLAAVLGVGGLVVWHLVAHQLSDVHRWPWTLSLWLGALVWAAVVAGSAVVRWFLLEYFGDSVIYIGAHKVSRFYETRQTVKDASVSIMRAIYRHGDYPRHIIAGHSLGSVIAYDTLNALTNEDALAVEPMQVTQRTALFLTFGSVLDKVAFLFRVQSTFSDIREVLAAAVQPLINDARGRPRWVNIHSPNDVIGGSLEYFDPQNGRSQQAQAPAAPIENVLDRDAWIPVLAHEQYWTNAVFVRTLIDTITGRR